MYHLKVVCVIKLCIIHIVLFEFLRNLSKETSENVKIMGANHGPLMKARGSVSGPPSLNPLIMPPKRPDGFNNQSMSGMSSSPIGSQVSFCFVVFILFGYFFYTSLKV